MNSSNADNKGISEIVGSLILIGIFVAVIGVMGVFYLSQPAPQKIPAITMVFSNESNVVMVYHGGGDPVPVSQLILIVNGVNTSFTGAGSDNIWSLGETISATASQMPGKVDVVYTGVNSAGFLLATMIFGQLENPPPLGTFFTISASAGSHGAVSPSGAVVVASGSDRTILISPESGYRIADVMVDGSSVGAVSSFTFVRVASSHTLTASFTQSPYVYIMATTGPNGSIAPPGITTLIYGGSQAYTITPTGGYRVADVLVNGVSVGAVANYTFTSVIANQTISAVFSTNTIAINATAGPNGAISPPGLTIVNYRANQTYTITPSAGYRVTDVLVNNVSVGAVTSYSFTYVTANQTISATFGSTYAQRVNCGGPSYFDTGGNLWSADQAFSPGNWGWAAPAGDQTYQNAGQAIANTADPTLYQTERYYTNGGFYNFTVPNGYYTVVVKYAEIYSGITPSNPRIFNVYFEGTQVENQLNLATTAGMYTAYDRTYSTIVNDGLLTIRFENVVENPKVSAIQVTSGTQPSPVASFTGTPTTGTMPLSVTFTDSSTNNPTSWFWDFGDGTNSTVQNPVHTYASAGVYSVALTTTNAGGSNTFTRSNYISVSLPPKPVAGFTGTPTTGWMPLSVTLTDGSTNSPTSWSWDFGDGTNATVQNPVHLYANAGIYTVNLTATNAGGSGSFARTNYITVNPTITASAGAGGTISPSGTVNVAYGGSQTFTITPTTGYHISSVLVDSVSAGTNTSYPFTNVRAGHTIAATFALNTYTITPSVSGGNGVISPGTVQTVNYGSTPVFTFTPNLGYDLGTVTVDGSAVTPSGNSYTFPAITANHNIIVTFVKWAAPKLSTRNPTTGNRGWPISIISLTGTGFKPGATVLLRLSGNPDIIATGVNVASATSINAGTLDLQGVTAGAWTYVVINPDGQSSTTLPFTVNSPAPTVANSAFSPASGNRGSTVTFSFTGTNYQPGATVALTNGPTTINAYNIVVNSPTQITCTIDIPLGATTGKYTATVKNTDNLTGSRTARFTVN